MEDKKQEKQEETDLLDKKLSEKYILTQTSPETIKSCLTLLDEEKEEGFDIFVIGGGSGGLALVKEAAELGGKVGIADYVKPSPKGTSWGLGGTCVNVGCIPKKLMHYASLCGASMHDQKAVGWSLPENTAHSWTKMQENVARHIKGLNWGYKQQLQEKGVVYYNKYASLLGKNRILLINPEAPGKEDKVIKAKNIVIAVGGRPSYETIPGAKECAITSDDIFWLTKPPGKTLIIGASYVALECAGFLSHIGFPVALMVRSIFLRGFDQEMASKVADNMKQHGVKMIKESVPVKLSKLESGNTLVTYKNVKTDKETEEEFDTVLLAIGRKAATQSLNLESLGVKIERNGKLVVDDKDQTTAENIYAIGDAAYGRAELTPVAIKAGKLLARRLLNKGNELMDYLHIPSTVYTPVEYGFCGYSEEQANAKYGKEKITIYRNSFKPMEWNFLASRENDICFSKLIVENSSNKVIGFHYFGPNAGEVTQGYAIGIKFGVTKEQWDKTIGVHPTYTEELLSLSKPKATVTIVKHKKSCC